MAHLWKVAVSNWDLGGQVCLAQQAVLHQAVQTDQEHVATQGIQARVRGPSHGLRRHQGQYLPDLSPHSATTVASVRRKSSAEGLLSERADICACEYEFASNTALGSLMLEHGAHLLAGRLQPVNKAEGLITYFAYPIGARERGWVQDDACTYQKKISFAEAQQSCSKWRKLQATLPTHKDQCCHLKLKDHSGQTDLARQIRPDFLIHSIL